MIVLIDAPPESVTSDSDAPLLWDDRTLKVAAVPDPARWLAHMEARHGRAVARVIRADVAMMMAQRLGRPIEIGRSCPRRPFNGSLLIARLTRVNAATGHANGLARSANLQWFAVSVGART